jgi:hypothetical protein
MVNADLPASGVVANTYGSGTKVPVLVVNSKGVVTMPMLLDQTFFTASSPVTAGKGAGLGLSGVLEHAASSAKAQQTQAPRTQVCCIRDFTFWSPWQLRLADPHPKH